LGVVFAIPTIKGEYLSGIVVRDIKGTLLCYFFKTIYSKPPTKNEINYIINDEILYVKQVTNMGFKDDTWIEIGKLDSIDEKIWVIPVFTKQDILTKKYYAVQVNEDLDEISQKEINEEESFRIIYKTGLAGSVFMERFLSKLIYK